MVDSFYVLDHKVAHYCKFSKDSQSKNNFTPFTNLTKQHFDWMHNKKISQQFMSTHDFSLFLYTPFISYQTSCSLTLSTWKTDT